MSPGAWGRRLLYLLRRRRAERDMEEEFRTHVEMETEANLRRGMRPEEARRRALVTFGGVERWKERAREARGTRTLEELGQDVRLGLRRLRRAPLLTAGVITLFGLGLGASGVVFGVLDRLVLSPPAHVEAPDGVVRLASERFYRFWGERRMLESLSWPFYDALEDASAYDGVAAWQPVEVVLGRGVDARQLRGTAVTGSYWSVLGVDAALGRTFGPDDDRPGAAGTVVLSDAFWRSVLGGDPDVVGRSVDFGRGPWTVVGVAPAGFTGVGVEPVDVWVPLRPFSAGIEDEWFTEPGWTWLRVVGRLAPGATPERAAAEATALHLAVLREHEDPDDIDPEDRILAMPLTLGQGPLASAEARVARWLGLLSLVVLAVVCANVANLLLARWLRERDRFAVQLALGGGRARIVREVLVEAALLAVAGGLAALVVTWAGTVAVRSVLIPGVSWTDPALGGRVLLFLGAAVAVVAVVSGAGPALRSGRREPGDDLRSAGRGGLPRASSARGALLALQAALSVMLLVGAGLFARSLQEAFRVDMGIEPEGVLLVRAGLAEDAPPGAGRDIALRAAERIRALPGVASASAAGLAPFHGSWHVGLYLPGRDSLPVPPGGGPYVNVVEPGYFETLRLDVIRGRALGPGDVDGSPPVIAVNQALAELLWPGQEAVGQCARVGSDEAPCARIVGVVEDARRNGLVEERSAQYYVAAAQGLVGGPFRHVLVRPAGSAAAGLPAAIRAALSGLDPALRFVEVRALDERVRAETRPWRLATTLLSAFGALALVVAALGLYALLSFTVAERRPELALRVALGATRGRIVGRTMGAAALPLAGGVAAGLGAAWAAAPLVEPLLFGVSSRDPVVFATVAAVLLTAGAAAGLPAALRASRSDPRDALQAR